MDEVVTEWGDIATAAKAEGSMGPAWKMFIKTKFFVAFLRSPDDDPKNFWLNMDRAANGAATLVISEVRERLDPDLGDGIITLSGTDIVCRIEDNGAIAVLLSDGAFAISKKRVEWLRSGIKMTKERIDIRKRLAAAAPAAPMPVLRAAVEVPLGSAPVSGPAPARGSAPAPVTVPDQGAPTGLAGLTESPYFKPAAGGLGILAVVAAVVILVNLGPGAGGVPAPLKEAMPAMAAVTPMQSAPAAAVYSATAPTGAAVPFTPMDNSFTVNVPGMAEEIELTPDQVSRLGDTRTHQYKLDVNGMLYTMESTDFLATPPQDRSAEMDAVQTLIIGNDGSLIRATPIGLRGATGRDVRVRLTNGGERAARFVFLGSKLCMVAVTVPDGEAAAAQIDAFINSFQLN
ncbi:MAG TPA: hypothetical protein VGC21_09895 [Telluria sp.]|jgi:hypothetical protein